MSSPLDALTGALPAGRVVADREVLAAASTDWTGRWRGRAAALLRPRSPEEVAAALAACAELGLAVVPQGGNTGLVGGAVPVDGEVVLSLRSLDRGVSVDAANATATAGAGATIGDLQRAAAAVGLRYGVDLASRDSATVGGTVATNAGGLRVLGLGDTRAQLLGAEAVLADGSVLEHLTTLRKDNTGIEVPHLLCGAEGTLGVLTAATVRLLAPAHDPVTVLVGLDDLAAAADLAGLVRRSVPGLEVLEVVRRAGLELVRSALGVPLPGVDGAVLVLAEAHGAGALGSLAAVVASTPGVRGEAVATGGVERRRLWEGRERHTEAIATLGPTHKLDVSLPLGAVQEAVDAVERWLARERPAAALWVFGHLGDGNVHLNVTGVAPDDDGVDDLVLRTVASLGGSISAEHGIGRAKLRWLPLNRSDAELATWRRLKAALDPAGVLNPGVLVPPAGAATGVAAPRA